MKIVVFYHYFIGHDYRAVNWFPCLVEQLSLIESTGLAEKAQIKMCITMPTSWQNLEGFPFLMCKQNDINITFQEKVMEYIHTRYPFVQIISVRESTLQPNLYEGTTLHEVYKFAQTEDAKILYIHNKGTIELTEMSIAWREILNHFCITEWNKRIKELDNFDVIGVADSHVNTENKILSGNFWWSKTDHIKKLPPPINSTYLDDVNLHPQGPSYRYSFEKWVTFPTDTKIHYVYNTKINHYTDYMFLEDILKELDNK